MISQEPENVHQSTNFITGMRGYSALAVFLIHSGGAGLRSLGYIGNEIVEIGKYGIISFFVISAFTITMSLDRAMQKNTYTYSSYITNRFFRIFPLFFLVGLFAFLEGGSHYYQELFKVGNSLQNFLLQVSLLNVFFVKHKNNLIGVEWCISLEFFYYLLFPFLFIILKKYGLRSIYFLFGAFLISFYSANILLFCFYGKGLVQWVDSHYFIQQLYRELFDSTYIGIGNQWGILKYAFSFVGGIFAYILMYSELFQKFYTNLNLKIRSLLFLLVLVVGSYIVLSSNVNMELAVTELMILLLITCSSRDFFVRIIFENPIIMYLGTISYSFYLTHFLVLYYITMPTLFLQFLVGLVGTMIISTFTYFLIEKPGIRFGRFISAKYLQKRYH